VIKEKLVKDHVGSEPVLLVVGADDQSVRAFRDRIPGIDGAVDFYRINGKPSGGLLIDAATGSEWNFQGCAISGKAKGLCLEPIAMLKDYWFDWRNYNPNHRPWQRKLTGAPLRIVFSAIALRSNYILTLQNRERGTRVNEKAVY
jgi:hypothetical protein